MVLLTGSRIPVWLATAAVPTSFFVLAAGGAVLSRYASGGPALGIVLIALGLLLLVWSARLLETRTTHRLGWLLRALFGLLGVYGLVGLPVFALVALFLPDRAAKLGAPGMVLTLEIGLLIVVVLDVLLLWCIRAALRGRTSAGFGVAGIVFTMAVVTWLPIGADDLRSAILLMTVAFGIAALTARSRAQYGNMSDDDRSGLTRASTATNRGKER